MLPRDKIELVELDEEFGDAWYLGKNLRTGQTGLFPASMRAVLGSSSPPIPTRLTMCAQQILRKLGPRQKPSQSHPCWWNRRHKWSPPRARTRRSHHLEVGRVPLRRRATLAPPICSRHRSVLPHSNDPRLLHCLDPVWRPRSSKRSGVPLATTQTARTVRS
jgi:hypothetical protein